MKPTIALLILACCLTQPAHVVPLGPPTACGAADVEPPVRSIPPWLRPDYVEPQWATELRELLNKALAEREKREGRP